MRLKYEFLASILMHQQEINGPILQKYYMHILGVICPYTHIACKLQVVLRYQYWIAYFNISRGKWTI